MRQRLKSLALTLLLAFSPRCGSSRYTVPVIDCGDNLTCSEHRVFISSTTQRGNMGGIAGADAICQSLASAAGLTRTYKAILSTTTANAKDRLTISGPVYVFTSATTKNVIADSRADLWDGLITNFIDRDESYNQIGGSVVHSGTLSDGTVNTLTCTDWTSNAAGNDTFGDSGILSTWIDSSLMGSCNPFRRIYCISQ